MVREEGAGTISVYKWSPVVDLRIIGDYQFWVKLEDGREYEVNMKPHLKGGRLFIELLDLELFNQAKIEEHFGGIEWPNGCDMCTDWIINYGTRVDDYDRIPEST